MVTLRNLKVRLRATLHSGRASLLFNLLYLISFSISAQSTQVVQVKTFDENLKPLNPNEITAYNFRHRLLLYVDPLRRNDSEIIYLNAPTLSVKERKYFIVEQKFSGSRIVSTSGTASFSITDNTYRFTSEGTEFSKYFESGIVKIKDLSPDFQPAVSFQTASGA